MTAAAEVELRKKAEGERRELERRVRLTSATSQLETRKTRDVADALLRKKDEVAEMRSMLSAQTLEISQLQQARALPTSDLARLPQMASYL